MDGSEQVHDIHYTPYNDNVEFIKNVIDNDHDESKDASIVEKNGNFIEMIYKEGNNDIDPTVAIVDTGCLKTEAGKPWLDS